MSGSGLPPVVLDSGIECWAPTTLLVPQVRGFLWVRKGGDKKWVRRYVLCRANFLYWFGEGEVERPAKPLGACCFEDMLVQPLEPPPENPELDGFAENAFWLSPQQEAKGGGLFSGGSKRVFEFCAETEEAAQEWTQALVVWRYSLLAQDRIQLDVTRAELDETAQGNTFACPLYYTQGRFTDRLMTVPIPTMTETLRWSLCGVALYLDPYYP